VEALKRWEDGCTEWEESGEGLAPTLVEGARPLLSFGGLGVIPEDF